MRGIVVVAGALMLVAPSAAAQAPPAVGTALLPAPPPPVTPVEVALPPTPSWPPLPSMWPEQAVPFHPPIERLRRSPGAITAGIVLTVIGLVAVPVGIALAEGPDPTGHLGTTGILLSTVGPTVLPAVGIPLIVYGARPLELWEKAAIPSWAIPSVAAGVATRSVALRWTF